MNCTTIHLSYKCIYKNINWLFFAYFVPDMKTYACRESKSAVLRGMIYPVPKLSPTTISLRSSAYPHIQIAPVILMSTFLLTCEDTQFHKLVLPLGLAYGVTGIDGSGHSSVHVAVRNLTRTAAFGIAQVTAQGSHITVSIKSEGKN